jgi:Dolichyl-phosphate-mannose-protein mannosyltransferase
LLNARRLVVVLLVLVALLGVGLLVASLLPTSALAARLVGATGGARGGVVTQDLIARFGERLRFAGVGLVAVAAGLWILRRPFEDVLAARGGAIGAARATDFAVMSAVSVLGLGLRLPFLGQPMRYDEALTFNEFASRPLYYGLSFYPDPNNHLLNTLLVHFAYLGLGNQPWVLRLPALIGGVLLAPATFVLARLLYGTWAALLGATLVAASSYLLEYSTNSRGYTLQALCFIVLLALMADALQRDSLRALLLAALVAAVGAYALPTMLYGVAVAAVWFTLELRRLRPKRVAVRHLAVSGLLLGLFVLLLYLPVVLVSGPERLLLNRFVTPLDAGELMSELPRSLARTWAFWNRDVPLLIGVLLVAGFVASTVAAARRGRAPLGLVALAVCLVLVLVQRVAPFERVWLFLLPLYASIAAGGLVTSTPRRWQRVAAGLAACVLAVVLGLTTLTSGSVLSSAETGVFPDAEAVAQSLRGRLAADDAVVSQAPTSLPQLQYYFARRSLPVEALVRPPDQARRVYVVTPVGVEPNVPGWGRPTEVGRYSGSVLYELERG